MKKVLIIVSVLLISIYGHTQTHLGDTWIIGVYGYQIKFGTSNIIHDTANWLIPFQRAKSNICDSNGNMLLMSNGWNIYNKQGQLIDDGDTMTYKDIYTFYGEVNSQSQNTIFLPKDKHTYYYISADCNDTCFANYWNNTSANKAPYNVLNYSVVDMQANGGAGKVIQKMTPLLTNQLMGRAGMMACKHGNGKDWWLIKPASGINEYYTFLFTKDSAVFKGKQTMPAYFRGPNDYLGQFMFNQDGDKAAFVTGFDTNKLFTMDFDRCYGVLSNFNIIDVPTPTCPTGLDSSTNGVIFSPNGRFIYVSKWSHILQYDTWDSTWFTVAPWDTTWAVFEGYTHMGLGVDGKIYIGKYHSVWKTLSVIENPDVKGTNCNFCRMCLRSQSIGGYLNAPPNMPNYDLGAKVCFPLQTSNIGEVSGFEIYPNPNGGIFHIKNTRHHSIKEIYNCIGQLLLITRQNEIDISNLAKGVYFVKCEGQTKKVVVE